MPGHVDIAIRIDGNCISPIRIAAAQERGVQDIGARGIELGDECIGTPLDGTLVGRLGHGKVVGPRTAGYISVAAGVDGNGDAGVVRIAPEIGGVVQVISGWTDLGHEGIVFVAAETIFKGAMRDRKHPGVGLADHVNCARSIHRNAIAPIEVFPAEVCGIKQRGTGGIQLGNKCIRGAASVGWLNGVRGWKIGGRGVARHIHIAGVVHGNRIAKIIHAAAQVGGVGQHRIDDEYPRRIVRPQLEGNVIWTLEHITGCDPLPGPVDVLVNRGLELPNDAHRGL